MSHSLQFTYHSLQEINHGGANKMSDRKYKQSGYMDNDRESRASGPRANPLAKPQDREGPRTIRMMAFGETSKCSACGEKFPPNVSAESSCAKCKADLHTCRQCTYFDPGARFECGKAIAARIVDKHARNSCELYAARIVVERDTKPAPPTDARQAFANLFKK